MTLRGMKLRELGAAIKKRAAVLDAVRASLPAKLASRVASAGLENGRLTLGVSGAAWASRLRYSTGTLRSEVGAALRTEILSVRIRVLPPSSP